MADIQTEYCPMERPYAVNHEKHMKNFVKITQLGDISELNRKNARQLHKKQFQQSENIITEIPEDPARLQLTKLGNGESYSQIPGNFNQFGHVLMNLIC